MKIHQTTITGDALLDWINTRSREEKSEIQSRINDAKSQNTFLFTFIPIEKIEKKFRLTILGFNVDPIHELIGLHFESPATRQGRADMESALLNLQATMEGALR